MYTQWDVAGNKYLLLESLLNIRSLIKQYSLQIENLCAGQTTNMQVDCSLASFLSVERWFRTMGKAVQPERSPSGANSHLQLHRGWYIIQLLTAWLTNSQDI